MSQPIFDSFGEITQLLKQTQALWKPVAFHQTSTDWLDHKPGLADKLLSLRPDQIELLHYEPYRLSALVQDQIPQIRDLERFSELPKAPVNKLQKVDPRFHAGIPGRKWQQVSALCASLSDVSIPILEYCAGKSHLGFYIEHCFGVNVTALEWQYALVHQANQRAQRENKPLRSHQIDVMTSACDAHFTQPQQVVALHACGELHERMLSLCIANHIPQISLAPCCYHKRRDEFYVPYSNLGTANDLVLSKSDLHTAVMETVTAGSTNVSQRKTLQIMRLGFDLLQRDLLKSDTFLSIPSMPSSWSRASFEDFCRHCASLKNLDLPQRVNWQAYWQRAQARFHHVSALDLIRAMFRRPLEVWLNMDKALWLEAQQYEVRLSTFCERKLSPRNILLQATLHS